MKALLRANAERRQTNRLTDEILDGAHKRGDMPMLPDGSIVWEVHDLPNALGVLVFPKDGRREVLKQLIRKAMSPPAGVPPLDAPRGDCGFVEFPNSRIALKTFHFIDAIEHAGVPALQANIAIHEGLRRLGTAATLGKWSVRAPEQLGALFRTREQGGPVWAMTRESGEPGEKDVRWAIGEAGQRAREALLRTALGACQVSPRDVALNDTYRNYLIDYRNDTLVRIDAFAAGMDSASIVPGTECVLNNKI